MKLFWFLNVTFHALNNSFTFEKKSPYSRKYHSLVVLTKDDFPLNDNDDDTARSLGPVPNVTTREEDEQTVFTFRKRNNSVYNGCDQRKPMNISDADTLLYFYQKFYEVYQKHELLKKLESNKITDHEKLKIMDECNHLLDTKYKHNPLYKGFDEFL